MPPLRDSLRAFLERKDYGGALDAIGGTRRGVRALFGLLFHEEELVRWRAVTMFGVLAGAQPELVGPYVFRLLYSLSEESSVTGWGSAQALGEIARVAPEIARDAIRPVVHFMDDEELSLPANRNTEQLAGSIWAIANLADVEPGMTAEMGPALTGMLSDPDARIRGLAAYALCRVGYAGATEKLRVMLDDRAVVRVYSDDDLLGTTVGELARRAVERFEGKTAACL